MLKYSLSRKLKARALRVSIKEGGEVYVSAPLWLSVSKIEKFLHQKADWITRKIRLMENQGERISLPKGKKNYLQNKERARRIITRKTKEVCQKLDLKFTKIRIGNQKTRWGSCTRNGVLSFNYKLVYLPENLRNYIIAHEVCHLREHNHSHRFWMLVGTLFPDWKEHRKELKKYKL